MDRLFRSHRTFPAFLHGIGGCPEYATCEYRIPDDCDWVALSPCLATSREEFQGILDQVRCEEERGGKFEYIPFPTSLDDVVYWVSYAIALGEPSCVIGWSVVAIPELVSLASIPADRSLRHGTMLP